MRKIAITQNKFALVSNEDFKELNQFKWRLKRVMPKKYKEIDYVIRGTRKNEITMHRQITKAPKGMDVDHINGNGLDNRRENLRVCTHAENLRNKIKSINNTSGYKGVWFNKVGKKWIVHLYFDGKNHHIGQFDTKEDAAMAYDISAINKFGEFAKTNFERRFYS